MRPYSRRTVGSIILSQLIVFMPKKPIDRVQALEFATKAQTCNVNLAILVSSRGFQDDCKNLTHETGIRLLSGEAIEASSEEILTKIFDLVLNLYDFRFHLNPPNRLLAIPDEPGVLQLFMEDLKIKGPGIDTTMKGIVDKASGDVGPLATGKQQEFHLLFPMNTQIIHPNTGQKTRVTGFSFMYWLMSTCDVGPNVRLGASPYFEDAFIEEELAKRNPTADPTLVEKGFDTVLRKSKYYYNPRLRFSYFCERTKKDLCHMVLVESYQGGHLLQARAILKKSLARQFVEITIPDELERLGKLYERFTISDKNLEVRFTYFVKSLEGAECIDELPLSDQQRRKQKADFFFNQRDFICELKSLKTDTFDKVEKILAPYMQTPEWPVIFGSVDLQQVLERFPNKEAINAKIVESVTDSIEGVIESANRQIRTTKETFALPASEGILVILNDVVEGLTPELINYRIIKSLTKTLNGEPRFPHVSMVMVISTIHQADVRPNLKASPILTIPGTSGDPTKVKKFIDSLLPKWARFDGRSLIRADAERFVRQPFKTARTNNTQDKKRGRRCQQTCGLHSFVLSEET